MRLTSRILSLLLVSLLPALVPACRSEPEVETTPAPAEARAVGLPYEVKLPGSPDEYEILMMGGKEPVTIDGRQMWLPWGREYLLREERLSSAGIILECTAGRNGIPYKPWLLVRQVETRSGVGVSIAYPGNWRIAVSPTGDGTGTVIRADTLPTGLEVIHSVGGLPVPGALISRFQGSWDQGALPITRYIRKHLLRRELSDWPWVQYNTWFDRYQNLEEGRLLALARLAADLGVEMFMIDAGWYGSQEDWSRALGDWTVNPDRLPHGIEPIAAEVRRLGMKFGMWIEIEHTSAYSEVARQHPDWFQQHEGEWVSSRGPLDFGNQEVLAWAKEQIDRLMRAYQLDYIKMDFNGNLTSQENFEESGQRLWNHYRGLFELWSYLRTQYPELVVENCSSGSLRMDPSIAAVTDTHWVSDEVGAHFNLAMDFAMTYLFPPEICNHWTTFPESTPSLDLESNFRTSMMGQFGLSGSILEWEPETLEVARRTIAEYKKIRPRLRRSEVYHLTGQVDPEGPNSFQAAQYFDPSTGASLLFAFRAGDARIQFEVVLRRLDSETTYEIRNKGRTDRVPGAELRKGWLVELPESGSSTLIEIAPELRSN